MRCHVLHAQQLGRLLFNTQAGERRESQKNMMQTLVELTKLYIEQRWLLNNEERSTILQVIKIAAFPVVETTATISLDDLEITPDGGAGGKPGIGGGGKASTGAEGGGKKI